MFAHERTTEQIETFFAPSPFQLRIFDYPAGFDYPGAGRTIAVFFLHAASRTTPGYAPMLRELRRIFDAHQVNDRVAFEYDTRVYYGQLS